jgi:hypothetical protein
MIDSTAHDVSRIDSLEARGVSRVETASVPENCRRIPFSLRFGLS